jgi:drug/metabolite transporter (DMT)-like permease
MNWLLLTAFSVISRSIYGVMTKVLSNEIQVSTYTQSTLLPLAGGIIAILISPLLGGIHLDFQKVNLMAIILMILGQGVGNVAYFVSMKHLNNSTAQIAFSSILLFNTALSVIVFHLHLSFLNIFGLILLILAIISVISGKVDFHKKGVALMVFSAFCFSIFQLSSADLSKQIGSATYLVLAYFGAALVIFIYKWKTIIKDLTETKNIKSTLLIPFLTAIPSLGNFTFAYYAYKTAPEPGRVAMLLTSQVVLGVLMSHFILKEKTHLIRKIGAAILVVLAAFLIKN